MNALMQRAGDTTRSAGQAAEERLGARSRHYADMLVLMRGLARRFKNLVNRISKAEMNATFIEYELFQLLKMMEECLDEGAEEFAGDATPGVALEAQAKPRKPLRYLAESGTSSLEIKARPDGMADIRIDGGKQFTLPPTLADLMTALSIDNGLSDDAFVGWKTVKEMLNIWPGNRAGR